MRWLVPILAASATALAVPAAAQSYGYGYGQPSYGYGYGSDFDYRRCYSREREQDCRERLRREADRYQGTPYRRDDGSYDRYGDYNRYGYGSSGYGQYGYGYDYGRDGRQPYYDPRTYGYNGGYYGNGYGNNRGYYGNGYSDGSALALTVLGIALGVQILGALDDRDYWDRHRHDDGYRDWCRRNHSSFDWGSGTYLHQDGYRRYCRRN